MSLLRFVRALNITAVPKRGVEVFGVRLRVRSLALTLRVPTGRAYDFVRRITPEEEADAALAGLPSPIDADKRMGLRVEFHPEDFIAQTYRRAGLPKLREAFAVTGLRLHSV